MFWLNYLKAKFHTDRGQGLVEYALILVLVSLLVIVVLAVLGPSIGNVFSNINDGIGGLLPTGG